MNAPAKNAVANAARAAGASVGLSGETIIINGGRPLTGRVDVKGAKNLVTKAMVAAILGDGPSVLRDVPAISDVRVVRGLLEVHGVTVADGDEPGELILDPRGVVSAHMVDIDAHAGSSRIPILFCGPLLHKLGEAFIPDLGGCRIGDRPIDLEVDGGVTADNAGAIAKAGANWLVAGSAVFKGGAEHYEANIDAIRSAALIARGEIV
jgi:UDP-N-acetylglucosamine 1-carboxyvinyltransferase